MKNVILTIFTPTYNRAHTLSRVYESLRAQSNKSFRWLIIDDGSVDNTKELVDSFKKDYFDIKYIYKKNGGLYTGYNTAYANIDTELCVCIDSDDFMPKDAVEKILKLWKEKGCDKYAGIEGLDFDIKTGKPIGGYFPVELKEVYLHDLYVKNIHRSDTKQVMRTDLMKEVIPMVGFPGEKNFNPIYLLLQVCDNYPLLVLNDNLCVVEYQMGTDSMSGAIYRQYIDSPRSFAKMRRLEMSLKHNTTRDRFRSAIHYVSSCIIAKDKNWLNESPCKFMTILALPLGVLLYLYIKYKNSNK